MNQFSFLQPMCYLFDGQNEAHWTLDLSDQNADFVNSETCQNQHLLNEYILQQLEKENKKWGVASYLESRTGLLKKYPQMVQEKRVLHLGLDIILPAGTQLYTPLDGIVQESFYEEGAGNYGGCILIKHQTQNDHFYALYGHLKADTLPTPQSTLKAGDCFGKVGDFPENGGWFHHTHLQILTEKAYQNGWIHRGYCRRDEQATLDEFCPDPNFMLKK